MFLLVPRSQVRARVLRALRARGLAGAHRGHPGGAPHHLAQERGLGPAHLCQEHWTASDGSWQGHLERYDATAKEQWTVSDGNWQGHLERYDATAKLTMRCLQQLLRPGLQQLQPN